ncbi:uncharacterized protein STEHIDRAFT_99133 [Stereum hirsutum FP-91666 SS1]|uniref:uncharacterized protein n=1 Tax=Stereum hirsutum (strain FP-91666) TaxID=721885 RepID=UPI0004449EF5|nr:uncharacterized protein STEHIDRAFT_99133 [Stereum hirsutum FP-91666 SS1]EIM85546.1 hypothetical protein STEHIDRAFT_99133 [Stereum hirsutum FP-91666 SS1]
MALVPPDPAAHAIPETEQDNICLPEHCYQAFDALYCSLTDAEPVPPLFADDKYPLFVTWNTRSSRPGRAPRLRGCIGNFEAMPIRDGIAQYALISAFRDHRFRKIEDDELESLECAISLLTDFEDADSYLDWSIGTHGISISFPHPSTLPVSTSSSSSPSPLSSAASLLSTASPYKPAFSATYLPEIAPEQGWDKIETVDSAIRKAGWSGRITEDLRRSVRVRRYQSRKCTRSWEEYVEWRKGRGGRMVGEGEEVDV